MSKSDPIVLEGNTLRYHEQVYDVKEILGSGASGQVFLVENRNLKNLSVFKVLRPHLARDERYVKRFEHEARVLAGLEDPGIVKVLQQGRLSSPAGLPFMQMEYARGQTLREALRMRKKFPVAEMLVLVAQILSALARAHKAGITHRDIKPENILVIQTPTGLITKIFDFGIFLHEERTPDAGSFVGTVCYASPEQRRGFDIDGKSDVYAVGVIAYEMVTGKRPFADEYDGTFISLYKTIGIKVLSLISVDPSIPIEVSEFVDALLEQDASLRLSAEEGMWRAREVHELYVCHYLPEMEDGHAADVQRIDIDVQRIDIEEVENRTSPDGRVSTLMKENFGKAETERDTAHRVQRADTDGANEHDSGERTKNPELSNPQESSSSIDAYFDSLGSSVPSNPISSADEADVNGRVRFPTTERVEPTAVSQSEDRVYGKDKDMVVAQRGDGTLRRGNGKAKLPDPPQNDEEEKSSEKYTTIRSLRAQIEEAEATLAAESSKRLTDEELRALSKELTEDAIRAFRPDLLGENMGEKLLAFRRDRETTILNFLREYPSRETVRSMRACIAEEAEEMAAERRAGEGRADAVSGPPQQEADGQEDDEDDDPSEGPTDEEVRAMAEKLTEEAVRELRVDLLGEEAELTFRRDFGEAALSELREGPFDEIVRSIRADMAEQGALRAEKRNAAARAKAAAESAQKPPAVSRTGMTWKSVAIYGLILAASSVLALWVLYGLGYFDPASLLPARPAVHAPLVEPAAPAVTPPSPAPPAARPPAVRRPTSPTPSSAVGDTVEFR
ncbi:MAG: serine/threonine protein kinase [Polyangiaceae bacterium]|nr:serine/threonine protein kinase [Polyangiaceae bacterium]